MPDDLIDAPGSISRGLRRMIILLCCAGVVGGLGCATMIATSAGNSKAHAHYNKPVLTDTVFALGLPDKALSSKLGKEDAIAFLGRKKTYLLVEGGSILAGIAHELDGDKVILENGPRELFLKDKTVWGQLSLRYVPGEGGTLTEEERRKLELLGFGNDGSGTYRLLLAVQGVAHPPLKVGKDQLPGQFKESREIAFFNPPDSKPPPDLTKVITVPLAIAVDVAATPIYLLGFVVLVISLN